MAEIRLQLDEADGGLPDICMRCGSEATVTKTKTMSWCPQWVGVLILAGVPSTWQKVIIGAFILVAGACFAMRKQG